MELKRMMEKLGQAKTHLELKKMIAEVDTTNSGTLFPWTLSALKSTALLPPNFNLAGLRWHQYQKLNCSSYGKNTPFLKYSNFFQFFVIKRKIFN